MRNPGAIRLEISSKVTTTQTTEMVSLVELNNEWFSLGEELNPLTALMVKAITNDNIFIKSMVYNGLDTNKIGLGAISIWSLHLMHYQMTLQDLVSKVATRPYATSPEYSKTLDRILLIFSSTHTPSINISLHLNRTCQPTLLFLQSFRHNNN